MSAQLIFWLVVIAVLVISLLIQTYIDNYGIDFDDFLDTLCDNGWITALIILSMGGIIFGFVFWKWWIMSLIILGIIIIVVIVMKFLLDSSCDDGEEEYKQVKTRYRCNNCGAHIKKTITENEDGDEITTYECDYCGIVYTKKDLVLGLKSEKESTDYTGIDLTDFEEEYFDACDRFFYKPYNYHTEKMIDSKYKILTKKINNYEDIYNDVDCYESEAVLDDAYSFLTENADEIEEYLSKTQENEIKKRYDFYTLLNTDDSDEETEDE